MENRLNFAKACEMAIKKLPDDVKFMRFRIIAANCISKVYSITMEVYNTSIDAKDCETVMLDFSEVENGK